jgi:UDP-N-acetylmuramoylalanine--D-glutamate ligase
VNDVKDASALIDEEKSEIDRLGLQMCLGGHPNELFTGSDLVVLSPGVPMEVPAIRAARSAGIEVISEVELAGRLVKGRLIGITGSNGKTTTTTLTGELMKATGAKVLVGGNIGTALSSLVDQSTDDSWLVAELSSFQLEAIDTLRVNVSVVTNITPDHLDRHPSFDAYVKAKERIFLNQTETDWAILNGQDLEVAKMLDRGAGKARKVWFSSLGRGALTGKAQIWIEDGSILINLVSATGSRGEVEFMPLDEISLPGMHNAENVMAAVAACICATGSRVDLDALRQAVRSFKGVEHRIEYVSEIGGVRFYNDSKATNVDSTAKALQAFPGRLVLILGGKDKGSDYTVLADLIKERVKHIVLIGAASDKIAQQLEGLKPVTRAGSMEDAVRKSMSLAEAGDTVVLAPACASFDMFDNYEHRGRVFKQAVAGLAGGQGK